MSLVDVYGLEAGDVIKLDEMKESDVSIRVGNHVRFKAKPGTVDGRMAAEVTRVLSGEDTTEPEGGDRDG